MAKQGTKVIDKGYSRILKDFNVVDGATVDVGILKGFSSFIGPTRTGSSFGPQPKKSIEVAEIAAIQEFGTRSAGRNNSVVIPERSFMRSTFDEKRAKYSLALKNLYGDVMVGQKTVDQALSLFGERVVGDIKRKLTGIRVPKNAESTQQAKGFDNPLIHTGTLRARIKKRVTL